jgi:cytidine deaminase
VNYSSLVNAARQARKNSHSPYSRFRVGAALLTASGEVYTGCNIESSSFSLTICAERTAIFNAVSNAERRFKAMAIASDTRKFVSPCGACRQVILDLLGNIDIVLVNSTGKKKIYKSTALLPVPFGGRVLPRRKKNGTGHPA